MSSTTTHNLSKEEVGTLSTPPQLLDISVFGLGKVGLTLASCFAKAGHRVIGVDTDTQLVSAINSRKLQTKEPNALQRLAECNEQQLRATLDSIDAVHSSELSFVIVPTPSNALGGFSNKYILQVCDALAAAIKSKTQPHTVAVVSTLLPGSSEYIIIPRLEELSGRKLGSGLSYCYNPSFIALGEIVQGIERPDYVLIGQSDDQAGNLVLAAHQSMIPENTPIARMEIVEAEISKLASNVHETMRVSFANMLFQLCSEIPGTDVDRITSALAHRMGKRFFKGAVPYGGPCWPRDNVALATFLDALEVSSRIPNNIDAFNEEHGEYILKKILEMTNLHDTVGLIGMAYKPGTNVIECSYAIDLANKLTDMHRHVVVWDPLAMEEVRIALSHPVEFANTAEDLLSKVSVAVLVNPLNELASIKWENAKNAIVVDCWRVLPDDNKKKCGRYLALGRGATEDRRSWYSSSIGSKLKELTT